LSVRRARERISLRASVTAAAIASPRTIPRKILIARLLSFPVHTPRKNRGKQARNGFRRLALWSVKLQGTAVAEAFGHTRERLALHYHGHHGGITKKV
jgi:hypothetical protein